MISTSCRQLFDVLIFKQSKFNSCFKENIFMSNLWNQFKNLFKEAEQSSPSKPLIHELIERNEAEIKDYTFWKNTLVRRRLIDWLNDQYAIYLHQPENIDEALDFLNTPSSKGFVIHFHRTRYSRRDVTHFFDYLKERVLGLNYRIQISDTRTYNRPMWVETVQRHYLKPKPNFERKGKINQQFGNVTIEFELRNDVAHYLKFQATSYKDYQFDDARDFKELMQLVIV